MKAKKKIKKIAGAAIGAAAGSATAVVVVNPTAPKIPGAAEVTVATVIDPILAAADEAAAIAPTAFASSFLDRFSATDFT